MIFVDFEKAFDSVEINAIMKSLNYQGIEPHYINLLKDIYTNCTSTITLNDKKTTINIKRGVRQGNTISPKLFTNCLEFIFRNINWDNKGLNIDGETLHHLKFADDIVLISTNVKDASEMLCDLQEQSKKCGLKINLSKTKIMCNTIITPTPVNLAGETIEWVLDYIYLGQNISLQDTNQDSEINRRIRLGWTAFGKQNNILRGNLPLCLKKKVFNQCVLPTMTYASETWTTNKKTENKLRTTQRAMERTMIGITRRDRWRNTRVREMTKVQDIVVRIKTSKWRWAGHFARRNNWTRKSTEWTPRQGRRNRGRPRARWSTDLDRMLGIQWMRATEDRRWWQSQAEAYIQQWID